MYLGRSNWKSPHIFQVGFPPSLIVCGIHGLKEFDCLLHRIEVQIPHGLSVSSNEIHCNCEIFYEIIPVCECLKFYADNFSNSFDAFFIAFEFFALNDGWTQYAFFNVQFSVCFNEGEAQ